MTPTKINPKRKAIHKLLGRYYRAIESKDFIFYANYLESDENGSILMYNKAGELVSDNYFAYTALLETIEEKQYTKISRTMLENVKRMNEQGN